MPVKRNRPAIPEVYSFAVCERVGPGFGLIDGAGVRRFLNLELSLEDIEGSTGRILHKQLCRVGDLGSAKCSFDSRHVLYSKLRPHLNKVALRTSGRAWRGHK